ncbi:MAG: glycoside hydrolase family 31 protein [Butyribacter sp.]|nr:glycoside hydrolase family 31 protein [bacterium]MDY3853890.1 glycoside hydrolase family 31 protein [Butyribacter sp.]
MTKKLERGKDNEQERRYQEYRMKQNNIVIDAITSRILRIHSAEMQKDEVCETVSFAIEENMPKEEIKVSEDGKTGRREWKTDDLTVLMDRQGRLSIYNQEDVLLCADYAGNRKQEQTLSEEELEQLRMEGHDAQSEKEALSFCVTKALYGDETIYGLGDKTGFLNKMGYDYMMWNSDNPEPHVENQTFKALYKSIPFFIVVRDACVYGIFLDNTYRSYLDMGYESSQYYYFGAAGGTLDYYFISGDTIAEVIKGYTMLTGRAPLPQMWTLGYQQSRWSYESEEEVLALAEKFREYGIPCDAIHLDIDYMERFKVFTVDQKKFPDMKKLSDKLADMGIKLVTIIDPGTKIEEGYDVYEEGVQKNFFAKDEEGNIYQNVVWPGDSVYPDFTSEKVREWWGNLTKRLTLQGVRGIWNDMNEPASFCGPLPDDVVFAGDGKERQHKEVHNIYGHLMAKATYEGLKRNDGRRPYVITRACYSGTQKYSTAWTGDNQSLWAHLQMSIPQLLNLGMSGMPMVGTDIGGFGANATPELFSRWIEASCFAPLFRNHSAKDTRRQEPWRFGEETLEVSRKYIALRYKFLPYLYDLCYEETQTGMPLLRSLVMHYQQDKNVRECNDEYLVGDKILMAPVVQQGMRARMVYLPEGTWVDYWTKERITGGRYILREAPLDVCPMYIKGDSILPVYAPMQSIEPENITKLTLEYYPADGREASYTHYQDNGVDFDYQQGKYNLYQFICCQDKPQEMQTVMLHEGYRKYQEICVECR